MMVLNGDNHNIFYDLTPWEKAPYRLIGWWDMEEFAASKFYYLMLLLDRIEQDYIRSRKSLPPIDLDEDKRLELEKMFRPVEQECQKLTLRNSVCVIEDLRNVLYNWKSIQINTHQVAERIGEVRRSVKHEMEINLFMYIPPERAEYYQTWGEKKRANRKEEIPLFGGLVDTKFPSAAFDIIESGNCFAAGRFTACVFHLMNVLQIGLMVFAKKFLGIPTDRANWGPLLTDIQKNINNMNNDPNFNKSPTWREDQEIYSQISSGFFTFKNAWRNYTDHGRAKFTQEEAENIFRNVRDFMQRLATRF